MCVANATPLIFLAKVSKLELLSRIFNEIQIPHEVKVEVVDRGKELGYVDAMRVEEAILRGDIIVHKLEKEEISEAIRISKKFDIDIGEAQVIILAKKKRESAVIMDDLKARRIAELYNLKPIGTVGILIECVKQKILTREDSIKILDTLIEKGFRLSIEMYKQFLSVLSELN
mgnify:CR=1 FL=1